MFSSKSLRLTRATAVIGTILLITGCGGGGSGGGGGDPTPTLPVNAVTISGSNAIDIANEAVSFATNISNLTNLKTEPPPSIPDVIELIIDQVTEGRRSSQSVDTGATKDIEDISS